MSVGKVLIKIGFVLRRTIAAFFFCIAIVVMIVLVPLGYMALQGGNVSFLLSFSAFAILAAYCCGCILWGQNRIWRKLTAALLTIIGTALCALSVFLIYGVLKGSTALDILGISILSEAFSLSLFKGTVLFQYKNSSGAVLPLLLQGSDNAVFALYVVVAAAVFLIVACLMGGWSSFRRILMGVAGICFVAAIFITPRNQEERGVIIPLGDVLPAQDDNAEVNLSPPDVTEARSFLDGVYKQLSEAQGSRVKDRETKLIKIEVPSQGEGNLAYRTCIYAVRQPAFTSVLDEEGAVVMFDNQRNPIGGVTTQVFDLKTGSTRSVRELTLAELQDAAPALREHFRSSLEQGIDGIVIFSDRFQNACREALDNRDPEISYWMESSIDTKDAKISRERAGIRSLLAADRIYYENESTR